MSPVATSHSHQLTRAGTQLSKVVKPTKLPSKVWEGNMKCWIIVVVWLLLVEVGFSQDLELEIAEHVSRLTIVEEGLFDEIVNGGDPLKAIESSSWLSLLAHAHLSNDFHIVGSPAPDAQQLFKQYFKKDDEAFKMIVPKECSVKIVSHINSTVIAHVIVKAKSESTASPFYMRFVVTYCYGDKSRRQIVRLEVPLANVELLAQPDGGFKLIETFVDHEKRNEWKRAR